MTAGYSGTPLARKLGIGAGDRVLVVAEPDGFRELLEDLPAGVGFRAEGDADVALLFVTQRAALEDRILAVACAVFPDGMVWVAWPKRASRQPTDVTEDVVREVALPLHLVDTKVAAISDVWSGLRVVWRREHRAVRPAGCD